MSSSSSLSPYVNLHNADPFPQIPETKEMIERYTAFDTKVNLITNWTNWNQSKCLQFLEQIK